MSNRFGWMLSALTLGATLGCGGGGDAHAGADSAGMDTTSAAAAPGGPPADDAAIAPEPTDSLAEGDVRIVTTNGGIDLALIGDSISSGLSPQALRTVRAETDTTTVSGTGFAAQIEKMVKGTVQGAVGKRVGFPISDVREVRYDGEKLVFEWTGERRKLFDNTKIDGKPLLASFAPEDARRFAAAVNARKGRARHL